MGSRGRIKQKAICHPDRDNKAFGLCVSCYKKKEYRNNPEKYRFQAAKYRKANPEKVRAANRKAYKKRSLEKNRIYARKSKLKRLYNLSLDEYAELLQKQNFKCLICEREKRLVIDHNHETGKIRGLLCANCNSAIGLFRENTNSILRAYEYLEVSNEIK